MDEKRRTHIATALHQYRETVSQHSFFVLCTMVEHMEEEPLPPNVSASVASSLRVRDFRRYLPVPKSIKSPRDLLNDDVRAELIKLARLDGVSHRPVNLKQREEYFTAIQTRIAEKNIEVAEFPPADLEYLCTLVSGITGPGLPYHSEAQQFAFVSSVEDEILEYMVKCVTVPIRDDEGGRYNELTDIWEDWEITIAFKIGSGPNWGGSYALYCRNADNEQWKWRYGVNDEDWYSDVYDSVEEFLGFYAHFKEQTEVRVRKDIRSLTGLLRGGLR